MEELMLRRVSLLLLCAFLAVGTAAAQNLNAAGATFPYPIYSKWFSEYHSAHSDVQINYQSIGSGGGIRQLAAGTVDFGASDKPLSDEEAKQIPQPIYQLPTVLGAVVPAYNAPGVSGEIKFTGEVLANIYLGKITNWNDKAIAAANPGVKLPDRQIVVIRRSDGSGTTFVWTDYLSKVSPEWKSSVGSNTSVKWPVGLGGKGNEGVAGYIRQMPGAIGYVELIYALQNNITFGSVKNASGEFVKASLQSTTAAGASAKLPSATDFRVSITNAPGKDAYPIASFTYLLIPKQWKDSGKKAAVAGFLEWMLDSGQNEVSSLNYAPLPKEVAAKEKDVIKGLK
jgi:phosphate transport system substrate-binding protein